MMFLLFRKFCMDWVGMMVMELLCVNCDEYLV